MKPTLTWTGGDDPDGDSVTYTVRYGTNSSSLTNSIAGIKGISTTVSSALSTSKKYYWQVVSKSNVNTDSITSDIWNFTTVEAAPEINTSPMSQSVKVGSKAIFSVVATGTDL